MSHRPIDRRSADRFAVPDPELPSLRWDVWSAAHDKRERVVGAMRSRFPNLSPDLIEDQFDEVCEAAAGPVGEPNAWPGEASLDGFLRWRLERRLLNHIERRAARHENLDDVAPTLTTDACDPAELVAAADRTAIYARHLADLPDDAKRYVADLQAGLKRAEIVERHNWKPKKLKLLRKKIQDAVLEARAAAAAAVLPWPVLRLWRVRAIKSTCWLRSSPLTGTGLIKVMAVCAIGAGALVARSEISRSDVHAASRPSRSPEAGAQSPRTLMDTPGMSARLARVATAGPLPGPSASRRAAAHRPAPTKNNHKQRIPRSPTHSSPAPDVARAAKRVATPYSTSSGASSTTGHPRGATVVETSRPPELSNGHRTADSASEFDLP